MFWNSQSGIFPSNGTTVTDNSIDFGNPNYRFKDLYLSGGVHLGGTGAANKLDDYEEGTWTPTFGGSGSDPAVTYASQAGTYVKVGSMVTAVARLVTSASSGGSGQLSISGLPFTIKNSYAQASISIGFNYNWGGNSPTSGFAASDTDHIALYKDAPNNIISSPTDILSSGNSYLLASITYETSL